MISTKNTLALPTTQCNAITTEGSFLGLIKTGADLKSQVPFQAMNKFKVLGINEAEITATEFVKQLKEFVESLCKLFRDKIFQSNGLHIVNTRGCLKTIVQKYSKCNLLQEGNG